MRKIASAFDQTLLLSLNSELGKWGWESEQLKTMATWCTLNYGNLLFVKDEVVMGFLVMGKGK